MALPTGAECGDPGMVLELAVLAEESGFDGVFLEDYLRSDAAAAPAHPIWIGGGYPNPGPTRRAARWDGACMYGTEQHDLQPAQVRALRESAGNRPYDVCVGGRPRRDGDREWLSAVADAGATWWAEYVPTGDPVDMRDRIRRGPLRID